MEDERKEGYVSFDGIDPAELVHALYQGARPLGMGVFHDKPGITVDEVRSYLGALRVEGGKVWIDYLYGRPLKLKPLDLDNKTFFARLYDRDAGEGAAQEIVDSLRKRKEPTA